MSKERVTSIAQKADDDWFTVKEAADLFKVAPCTIRDWLQSGVLEGQKMGRTWRISRTAVLKLGHSMYGTRPAAAS